MVARGRGHLVNVSSLAAVMSPPGPLRDAAAASKGRDLTPLPVVATAIVAAIVTGRDEVRLPRTLAPLPALAEAPRALTRALFRRYAAGPSGSQA
jgi:CBS domain-containing protein